jgi:hypothetical protein
MTTDVSSGMDWKLHWILIVIPPYYKKGTNNGTPENHPRNGENSDRFSSFPDGYQPNGSENQPRKNGTELTEDHRRHEGLPKRDEGRLRRDGDLSRIDGGKSEVVHEEVPKEEVALETVRALKEPSEERHVAVRRLGQPKKQTNCNGGSRKKLTTACRGMTRPAIPTRRKRHGRQGPGQDNVAKGTSKERTFGKGLRAQPECNNGRRNRGLKSDYFWEARKILTRPSGRP